MNKKVVVVITSIILFCVMVGLIIAVIVFAVNANNLATRLNESNSEVDKLQDQLGEETIADQDITFEIKETITRSLPNDSYDFVASIPFAKSNNADLQTKFNEYVSETLTDEVTEFSSDLPSMDGYSGKYSFESSYEIIFQNEEYISIRVLEYSYLGGVHGSSVVKVINYYLTGNQSLVYEDLFDVSPAFENELSVISRELLVNEFGEELRDGIESGTQSDLKNFEAFNFTDSKLIINFQEYQVGPYALGIPYVEFPLNDLESFMK